MRDLPMLMPEGFAFLEVVDKLKKGIEYRRRFNYALGNYSSVFRYMDELEEKFPQGKSQEFPENWTDPLELFGGYLKN